MGPIEIDLRRVDGDWTQLNGVVQRLPSATMPLLPEQQSSADGAVVLYDPEIARFADLGAFWTAGSENVGDDDAALGATWKEVKKDGDKAAKQVPGFLDYLVGLLPSDIFDRGRSMVIRVIETLKGILKRIVSFIPGTAELLWDVIRNPDDYYLRLRGEVVEWCARFGAASPLAQVVTFVPDVARLYIRLLLDDRVSASAKKQLARSLLYLVMPIDLIPEAFLGPIGYVDDVVLLAHGATRLLDRKYVSEDLLEEHWSGSSGALRTLVELSEVMGGEEILDIARKLWGSDVA